MTTVFRGDRLEIGGDRVIAIRAIPGKLGQHRLECGTCGESAAVRELFDGDEGFARQWIAKHETCELKPRQTAKSARRKR